MKFIVSRTSLWDDEESPCEEAKRDIAVGKTVKEPFEVWSIELNTLDELMDFFDKHGRIVITDWWNNREYTEIEIYDDYRE